MSWPSGQRPHEDLGPACCRPGDREPGPGPIMLPRLSCLLFSREVVSDSFATPWTVAHQSMAPLSMRLSRQEYWSSLPFPPPGDLPDPGVEPSSPAREARFCTTEPPGKPQVWVTQCVKGGWHGCRTCVWHCCEDPGRRVCAAHSRCLVSGLSSVGSSVPARHPASGGRGRLTGACLIRGPWWLAPPWGPPREHASASACSRGDREGGGTQV